MSDEPKAVVSSLPGEAPQAPEEPKAPTLGDILLNLSTRLKAIEDTQAARDAKLNDFMNRLQKAAEAGPPPQAQQPGAPQGTLGSLMQLLPQMLGSDGGGGGDAQFAQIGKDMFGIFMQTFTRRFARDLGVREHVTIEG